MSAVVFLLVCFLSCSVSEDPQLRLIAAKPGDDVILPCRAPNNVNIAVVKWTRSNPERLIYLKIDGNLKTADNRVQLKHDEMKNGELSLILKNVTRKDEGAYVCGYMEERATQIKLISSVILKVTEQTVKSGDDVTLHCHGPKHEAITSLKWIRSDLKTETDEYVFFFRDGQIYENYQHPSFHGRVELKDPQMKNGDVSVILKNVNTKDSGTYECRVSVKGTKPELMNIINLKVKEGETSGQTQTEGEKEEGDEEEGKKDRNLGRIVGLPVTVVFLLLLVAVVFYMKHKGCSDQPVPQ